jgi:glycosyltransferase involved in cell wall biosynthesis
MKVLVISQIVDLDDTFLGFFHSWIKEFSKNFSKTTVICLKRGRYDLPGIEVLSLGKEVKPSRYLYILKLIKYAWTRRDEYDAVFVHMNQEYVLVLGWLWKILGKRIYMWRNHHIGSRLTDLAAAFCDNVFCTSKYSYTAKYKKTIFMPVGIDTDVFTRKLDINRNPDSIMYIGRVSPIKKVDMLLHVLKNIRDKGLRFTATICGDHIPSDLAYVNTLKNFVKENNLEDRIKFIKGVPYSETVKLYNQHEICVNLSHSGMFDKTIFESMACEGIGVSSNLNLKGEISDNFLYEYSNPSDLEGKLVGLLESTESEIDNSGKILREYTVSNHSLKALGIKLNKVMSRI